MMRRVMIAGLICAVAYGLPASVSAQRGNMSDASGATVGLFSRLQVRAFAAPPAPPPTLVISREILDALCVERSDAMLVYASLSRDASDEPTRTAIALLRGGARATAAAKRLEAVLVAGGAGAVEAEGLIRSVDGLLAAERPGVPDVATAVSRFNELVEAAPREFLLDPPAEFLALRHSLGRLTAAANVSFSSERVYPGLPPTELRYANDAAWLVAGVPIEVLGKEYLQFGNLVEVGERQLRRVAEYKGVRVLSETPAAETPARVYVPLRRDCDIVLQPYVVATPVIKGRPRTR